MSSDNLGNPAGSKDNFPFLSLPREIRDEIYRYAVDWPDFAALFGQIQRSQDFVIDEELSKSAAPLCTLPRPHYGSMSTPSCLLVNHQICSEALEILYKKPLILDLPPPYIPQLAKPMDITEFVGEATLQSLRFVILKMSLNHKPNLMSGSAKCWLKTVEMLLDVWCVRNCLEQVQVQANYIPPSKALGWTFAEAAHHKHVMGLFSRLRGFGEQVWVVFDGVVPEERLKRMIPERRRDPGLLA